MAAIYYNHATTTTTDDTWSISIPYKTSSTDSTAGNIDSISTRHSNFTSNLPTSEKVATVDLDPPKTPQPLPIKCQSKPEVSLIAQFKQTIFTKNRFGGIGTKNFSRR